MKTELKLLIRNDIEVRKGFVDLIINENDKLKTTYKNEEMFKRVSPDGLKRTILEYIKAGKQNIYASISEYSKNKFIGNLFLDKLNSEQFMVDDFIKKCFIYYCHKSNKNRFQLQDEAIIDAIQIIDIAESKSGKDVISADKKDLDIIIDEIRRFSPNDGNALLFLKTYLDFVGSEIADSYSIDFNTISDDFVKENVSSERKFINISKNAILQFCKFDVDIQWKVALILVFNGFNLAHDDIESDEVRSLKWENVDADGINIVKSKPRKITLRPEFMRFVEILRRTPNPISSIKPEFEYSPFIFNGTSNNSYLTSEYGISKIGYRIRLDKAMEEFSEIVNEKVTPHSIKKAGMIYFTYENLFKGMDLKEAVFNMLIRFGHVDQNNSIDDYHTTVLIDNFISRIWRNVYANKNNRK